MSAEKIYQNDFLPIAKYLLKELDYYGENQFKRKTIASDWTIGQLYDHLIIGSNEFYLKSIRDCIEKKNGSVKGSKSILGYFVFLFGTFPPLKFKTSTGYVPNQIENISKAKDRMYGFLKEMQKLSVEIDKNADDQYKIKHRKFGRLTAKEWYRATVMHQKHHLKQKHRIDKILRTFVKEELFEEVSPVN